MLFFARFKEVKEGIVIFRSREDRDSWVNYQDDFSIQTETTAENAAFKRIPITTRQAENLAGDSFDDAANYEYDPIEGVLYMACKPRLNSDLIEDQRYKLINDLFREIDGQRYFEQITRAAERCVMKGRLEHENGFNRATV